MVHVHIRLPKDLDKKLKHYLIENDGYKGKEDFIIQLVERTLK